MFTNITVFSLGATVAPNITTMLICRGLAGLLGSPVFAIYGGSLADLFFPDERGPMVALFTLVLQGAPTFGPVPSSILGSFLHWRWLLGFLTMWGGLLAALMLFMPETEPNAIARKLEKSQDFLQDAKAPVAEKPRSDGWSKVLLTPISECIVSLRCKTDANLVYIIAILRHEPIVSSTTIFHSFVYGLLFLLLEVCLPTSLLVPFDDFIIRHTLISTTPTIRCPESNQA